MVTSKQINFKFAVLHGNLLYTMFHNRKLRVYCVVLLHLAFSSLGLKYFI